MIKVKEMGLPTFNDIESAELLMAYCKRRLNLEDLGLNSNSRISLEEAL